MPDFRFTRLEKYRVGGTKGNMELNIPMPASPSGKVYRWCPNEECIPRLFLLGNTQTPETLDGSRIRRAPGSQGTTCPYCGTDADDDEFNYDGDIKAIQDYIAWAASKDINDHLQRMTRDFNRSQHKGGFISIKMDFQPDHIPKPRAWREDLIRNLACNTCGREYGVYAIALFCPDCGCNNLHVHFEREIELILQQVDLAESVAGNGNRELSYRILGNAHEDVLTAFETYQKTAYKHLIRQMFPTQEAQRMTAKRAIGNRFQNVDRATALYTNLSIEPFNVLTQDELAQLRLNIEKRHVIGHNLSMADDEYLRADGDVKPGTTVQILADQVAEFTEIARKVVLELERSI